MFKSAYSSTTSLLGSIASGVALFNFARQYYNVGLNGIFIDIVDFYQKMFFPVIDFVSSHVAWMIPTWNKNIIVLVVAVCAIHAKSVSRHFELKFDQGSNSGQYIGQGSILAQIIAGFQIAFAHFAGAADISAGGYRLTAMTTGTITGTTFLFLSSLSIFIPYIRNVFVVFLLFSALSVVIPLFTGGKLTLIREDSVKYLNKKVFAMHYLGAVVGALIFFMLNRYAG